MDGFDWAQLLSMDWPEIGLATLDTLTMLGASLLFTVVFGLPLGVLLYVTSRVSCGRGRACMRCCPF